MIAIDDLGRDRGFDQGHGTEWHGTRQINNLIQITIMSLCPNTSC